MNFLGYFSTALVAYLGLAVGLIVMRASKEEQKAGKKFFVFMQKIILLLIIVFLLYFLKSNLISFLIIFSIALVFISRKYKIKMLTESYYIFPLLGVIFYLSSANLKMLVIGSSLIFLYGLVTASLLINFKKKNYPEIILNHISFLIIALLLFSFSTMF